MSHGKRTASPVTIPGFETVLQQARTPRSLTVKVGETVKTVMKPFPSPADWRDLWFYSLLIDRFNNPHRPPHQPPWDGQYDYFQGGTLEGVRARLDYLAELGVGAILLSPVLKNGQHDPAAYHGYGIQDFLTIEPRFASNYAEARRNPALAESELSQLVTEAHARGLYVMLDVVLHHVGDLFEYPTFGAVAPWRERPYPISWRDEEGRARAEWDEAPADAPREAAVWPAGLRRNEFFGRRGNALSGPEYVANPSGDYFQQKELALDYREDGGFPVRDFLIDIYTYLLAKYDFDGYRLDALKFIGVDFAGAFSRAIHEFALSIGKNDFFIFAEVPDSEDTIASYVGLPPRTAAALEADPAPGADAAFDFPLFFTLPSVLKGLKAPVELARLYAYRSKLYAEGGGYRGAPNKFFVTFLDNHDQLWRFRHCPSDSPCRFDDQLTLALGCLFSLQGIPCLYYGTEQGLHGTGERVEAVREALWGKDGSFDLNQHFARVCRRLSALRREQPALRYGRQYFRPTSTDGVLFGITDEPGGVFAFSRILSDHEVLVAANCSVSASWTGQVVVDGTLNSAGTRFDLLFSNKEQLTAAAAPLGEEAGGRAVRCASRSTPGHTGPTLSLTLRPMEIQILSRRLIARGS